MQKERNFLGQSVAGTAAVVVILLLLSLIPEFDIGDFHFKRIKILSDVLPKHKVATPTLDSTVYVTPAFIDTCKTGVTCFEDYTLDTVGLLSFMQALDSSATRKVRIAWFGDSFVEGDIFLDPLRDTLQAVYGGSGVGYLPITSEVAGFRQTVLHQYHGFDEYSAIGERSKNHPLGFAGRTFIAGEDSEVSFAGIKRKRLGSFPSVNLFFGNCSGGFVVVNNDTVPLDSTRRMRAVVLKRNVSKADIAFSSANSDLYGVSIESETGIALDNFSMRGNSGVGLSYVSEDMYRRFDELHHPDLVVIAYGLNVTSPKAKNYDWYMLSMKKTVEMMKRSFPKSSILIVGCPDRGENYEGTFQTMRGLNELIAVQRKIAADSHLVFWDMQQAMGGDSTMVQWAGMSKHAYANKDYTHLTFYGGKKMADITMTTLLYEKEKFDRRKPVAVVQPKKK